MYILTNSITFAESPDEAHVIVFNTLQEAKDQLVKELKESVQVYEGYEEIEDVNELGLVNQYGNRVNVSLSYDGLRAQVEDSPDEFVLTETREIKELETNKRINVL